MTDKDANGDGGRGGRADARTARLLVAAQFVLIGAIVLVGGGDAWPVSRWLDRLAWLGMVAGIVVMVLGATRLGRGLTAAPLPNKHAELQTGGCYRYVRHPIYAGLLLFAVAHTIASASWVQLVLCLLLGGLISVKARWEERHLAKRFPDYCAYAARTPRFVPFMPAPTHYRGVPATDTSQGDSHV